MFADIIIDITHEKLDRVFCYRVPEQLTGALEVGTEVIVPFGRGNRETRGYVVGFSEKTDYELSRVKEIIRAADESVAIESRLVALAAWMHEHYGGTMIQALKTVLPIKRKEQPREKRRVRLLLDEEEGKKQLDVY
ncbi:MAG: primosomal protein N', partial [[Clostridium] hylemonae]